jgi:hypothetical protein
VYGLDIYKAYRRVWGLNYKKEEWTPEDDARLKHAVELHGDQKFTHVAKKVDGKRVMECYYRWFKHNNLTRNTNHWTDEEDLMLGLAVLVFSINQKNRQESYHRKISWIGVSRVFPGTRTDVQVRERFMNILNPLLTTKQFSESEKKI